VREDRPVSGGYSSRNSGIEVLRENERTQAHPVADHAVGLRIAKEPLGPVVLVERLERVVARSDDPDATVLRFDVHELVALKAHPRQGAGGRSWAERRSRVRRVIDDEHLVDVVHLVGKMNTASAMRSRANFCSARE
jgi:hypothetical protein